MKAAAQSIELDRVRSAWQGRVSGCLLGKPLEVLSFREGLDGVRRYLGAARALPLRDYVPFVDGTAVGDDVRACCLGLIERAEPDDDILRATVDDGARPSTAELPRIESCLAALGTRTRTCDPRVI